MQKLQFTYGNYYVEVSVIFFDFAFSYYCIINI